MRPNVSLENIRQEHGSILLWTLGCFFISLMAIMTAISVASVSQAQRDLQNLTDASALAAANQIAVDSFLMSGDFADLKVDDTNARIRVVELLQTGDSPIVLRGFTSVGMEVEISTSTIWKPPWAWLGLQPRTLTAQAKASIDRVAGG